MTTQSAGENKPSALRIDAIGLSWRVDRRLPLVWAGLVLALLAVSIINLGLGSYAIAPWDVAKTLFGASTLNAEQEFIVNGLRLPRTLAALGVGIALGVSGAVLQGLTRNPLADPGIIGVNQGAGLAAVSLIVAYPGVSVAFLPFAAFAGALVVAVLIYRIAWRGGISPLRLILAGVGIAAVATAITSTLIAFGNIYYVNRAVIWLTGSVYARGWNEVVALLPWLAVFLPLAFFGSRHLNALGLGDGVAGSLGVRIEAQRGLLLVTAVALAGAAVATAGTIGFVGLMAPHIGRRLVGPMHGGLLPTAALVGGLLLVTADTIGRNVFAPIDLPAGILTAVVGVPFFFYVLFRSRKLARGGVL